MDRLNSIIKHEKFNSYALLALYVIVIGFGIFMYKTSQDNFAKLTAENEKMSEYIDVLQNNFASTTESLSENIATTKNSLSGQIAQSKNDLDKQLGNVQGQVGSLSGTLTTLEKLSKTDAELLQKYSKVFFLNEHYAPASLTKVPAEFSYYENRNYLFNSDSFNYLDSMLKAAKNDGIELYVYSAYRSFNEQEALKGQYTVTYGAGTANQFSADQGYSEHQLGTTVDLITTGIGGTVEGFDNTAAYTWLQNNAHKYGFIMSYPENNDFYVFEPWHWRFVGRELAQDLHSSGKSFYDLEQREIDGYLVNLFD